MPPCAHVSCSARRYATAGHSLPSSLLARGNMQGTRHPTSSPPNDDRTASPASKSHSPTASAAPAASFKRRNQTAPRENLAWFPSVVAGAALIGFYRFRGAILETQPNSVSMSAFQYKSAVDEFTVNLVPSNRG